MNTEKLAEEIIYYQQENKGWNMEDIQAIIAKHLVEPPEYWKVSHLDARKAAYAECAEIAKVIHGSRWEISQKCAKAILTARDNLK